MTRLIAILLLALCGSCGKPAAKDAPRAQALSGSGPLICSGGTLENDPTCKPSPYSGDSLVAPRTDKEALDKLERDIDQLLPLAQREHERCLDAQWQGALIMIDEILKANPKAPDTATITIGNLRALRASMKELRP